MVSRGFIRPPFLPGNYNCYKSTKNDAVNDEKLVKEKEKKSLSLGLHGEKLHRKKTKAGY